MKNLIAIFAVATLLSACGSMESKGMMDDGMQKDMNSAMNKSMDKNTMDNSSSMMKDDKMGM